jgi:hypothetical protein
VNVVKYSPGKEGRRHKLVSEHESSAQSKSLWRKKKCKKDIMLLLYNRQSSVKIYAGMSISVYGYYQRPNSISHSHQSSQSSHHLFPVKECH